MTKTILILTAAAVVLITALPNMAQARRHIGNYGLPYPISYNHNYGPGPLPGTFAYYDGPATVHCAQSAATYLGQDNRRHPCN
jgi:hypothetical protein